MFDTFFLFRTRHTLRDTHSHTHTHILPHIREIERKRMKVNEPKRRKDNF